MNEDDREGQEPTEPAEPVQQPDPSLAEAPPEDAVGDELRAASAQMREEADRIAALGTGTEQVDAAERFAEDAGRLDEQVGSAARAADDEGRS